MTELLLANRAADWRRLKALVLHSVSSRITRRVYNLALDEFIEWFGREPRPGFTKATVNAWRGAPRSASQSTLSSSSCPNWTPFRAERPKQNIQSLFETGGQLSVSKWANLE
jgi:hypothetical protein